MFGHHNDVITQDQNTDASVALTDDDMAAMATPQAHDQPQLPSDPASDQTPQYDGPQAGSDQFQPAAMNSDLPAMAPSAPAVDDANVPAQSPDDSAPILSGFMQPAAVQPEPDAFVPAQDDTPQADQLNDTDPHQKSEQSTQPEEAPEPGSVETEEEPKLLIDEDETNEPTPEPEVERTSVALSGTTQSSTPENEDLLHIKQDALEQLSPLVDQLEQEPEQKFRTLLMLIQASDNRTLLSHAYKVALQIDDEKVRAQALLDVVNEINYFTQDNSTGHPDAPSVE